MKRSLKMLLSMWCWRKYSLSLKTISKTEKHPHYSYSHCYLSFKNSVLLIILVHITEAKRNLTANGTAEFSLWFIPLKLSTQMSFLGNVLHTFQYFFLFSFFPENHANECDAIHTVATHMVWSEKKCWENNIFFLFVEF